MVASFFLSACVLLNGQKKVCTTFRCLWFWHWAIVFFFTNFMLWLMFLPKWLSWLISWAYCFEQLYHNKINSQRGNKLLQKKKRNIPICGCIVFYFDRKSSIKSTLFIEFFSDNGKSNRITWKRKIMRKNAKIEYNFIALVWSTV